MEYKCIKNEGADSSFLWESKTNQKQDGSSSIRYRCRYVNKSNAINRDS